ncbi:hypothetical protein AMS68_006504 [Peltaster fructicola]|uniref:TPR-like protein n=1 Tax=Peltaster fructicola TaxID=286661 RepID=A0A6H0Y1X6_9PEZI|nr:hypothetical protein AMS68_006504 [Peltaster fructicola]
MEVYPDPTDDEAEPDPYFVLRQGARGAIHTSEPRSGLGEPVSEAARQYALLANQLPNVTGSQNGEDDVAASEDEAEGIPMANRYLNLHPHFLEETDREDFSVDESEIEAATDNEVTQPPTRGGLAAGKGRGKGRKRGWKWALKGTAHDPKLNKGSQEKPRSNVKKTGRRRKTLDPGHEFKIAQMRATRAFVEGQLDEALEAAREAVQANPEIFAAHSLLAEILLAKGQKQDSLAAQLSGAVTARDANNWIMVAQQTLDYAGDERTEEVLQQAIFCYTQAIDLEKREENNFEARVSKMHLWMELGEFTKARRDCKQLVGLRPHDIELVRQMAELCAMTGDNYETSMARKSYEFALEEAYATVYNLSDDELGVAWSHLNIYLELVDRTAVPADTIFITKRHARKFLGRADENFWDNYQNDDRELDTEHTRRYDVIEYQQGRASRDRAKYGDGLPLEIRIKLGLFRLKMDKAQRAEAMLHFEHLKQYKDDPETLYDMFFLVASQLAAKSEHEEAIQYFEPIKNLQGVLTDDYWMRFGSSLKALARYEDAAECYLKAGELNPLNINARIDLAHLYQDNLGDKESAFKVVEEIIGLNKKDVLRREKLHMRPKAKAPKKGKRSRQADVDYTSEEVESSADDLAVKPVRARKKRKPAAPTGGIFAGLPQDGEDAGLDPEEAKRRKQEARRAARRQQKIDEGRSKLTKANERKMEVLESMADKIAENYETVERLWPALETTADEALIDEWMDAAVTLYEIFRSVKHFFPTRDKHQQFKGFLRLEPGEAKFMNEMETWKKQLEANGDGVGENMDFTEFYTAPKAPDDNVPKDFYSIPFDVWHHIFVDLALMYARRSRQAACYQVIDDGLYSANVFFHNPEILNTTQATSLCCGFIFNDSERLCFAARWFLNRLDLRSGASFQLFSGVNRLSFGNNLWFSAGPTQKHMLRSVKALDYHYFTPEVRKRFDWSLQLPTLRKRVEKHGDGTGHLDANALLTYGHMVGVANHSQSALPYFFRAYALQPDNISINLSIATMYIQNAMKRQTDNRQYGVMQGLSFLYNYYDTRSRSEGMLEKQEAEYNIARTWHMLGLTHLAIGSYEKAMAMGQAVDDENEEKNMRGEHSLENFAQEAAFALMNIYAITGNDTAAMELTEKWLVL